jgi:hypothetical protein
MRDDAMLEARINAEALTRAQEIAALRAGGGGSGGGTLNVNCNAGETIAQALAAGASRIVISGTCAGPVTINRDDVALQGETSAATIQGPAQPTEVDTVVITGHRVTMEALRVTGGRNGITGIGAANLKVRNVTVHNVGRSGISYAFGSSGTVEGSTIEFNARDGIVADAAFVRIINNTIQNNDRIAILIVNGANATIGLTERLQPAGNTIQQNKSTGIQVSLGSFATIASTTVTANGGSGIGLSQATATIVGGNTISDNTSSGIVAVSSRMIVGDMGPGLPTLNTISGNGNPGIAGGIFGGVGSSLLVNNAQITGNKGTGIIVSLRSTAQMSGSTIQSNAGDGVRLLLGSALLPLSTPSGSTLSGNSGAGISCTDGESSVVNLGPPALSLSGNGGGDAPSCTGF